MKIIKHKTMRSGRFDYLTLDVALHEAGNFEPSAEYEFHIGLPSEFAPEAESPAAAAPTPEPTSEPKASTEEPKAEDLKPGEGSDANVGKGEGEGEGKHEGDAEKP